MAEKPKLPKFKTPKGTLSFPKLNEMDTKFKKANSIGTYSCNMIFDANDAAFKDLIERLQPLHDEAVAEARAKFKELKVAARKKLQDKNGDEGIDINPIYSVLYDEETEEETGEVKVSFSRSAGGTSKAGKPWKAKFPIFDAKGQKMGYAGANTLPPIWGGTTAKVSFEVSPYFVEGTGLCGIKLTPLGVQIIDLKSGGGATAEDLGFEEEDGFEYDEEKYKPKNDTFDDETESDETDGESDF